MKPCLHHVGCLVEYFAEKGYQLSPEIIPYFLTISRMELDQILRVLDIKAPDTVVISLQTVADISGAWFVTHNRSVSNGV